MPVSKKIFFLVLSCDIELNPCPKKNIFSEVLGLDFKWISKDFT